MTNTTTTTTTSTRRSIILSSSCTGQQEERSCCIPPPPAVLLLKQVNSSSSSSSGQQDHHRHPEGEEVEEDENDSVASLVSSLNQEEDDTSSSSSSLSSTSNNLKPRSIFGSYWKAEGDYPPPKQLSPPPRATSPNAVMDGPYYRAPYSPTMDMLLVGQALEVLENENEEDDMNTYERTLRNCEVVRPSSWRQQQPLASRYANAPLWMKSWLLFQQQPSQQHQSAPSLLLKHNLQGLGGMKRQMQSESALLGTPLKSALRQGRFSIKSSSHTTMAAAPVAAAPAVHFQPRIQVCSYQPPVESWAAEGWSQWFGS